MKKKIKDLFLITLCFIIFCCGCAKETEETEEKYADKYIDLHMHLDGAITPEIAKKLASLQGIEINASDEEIKDALTVPEGCASLDEFLECFELPGRLLQTKEGISEAVYLVMEQAKADGVIYMEVRFAPQKHCEKGLTQEEVIQAAIEGLKKSDLKGNLILCCMRGEGNDKENEETVRLAKKYLVEDGGVVAVDLAGAEAVYKTENYGQLFSLVKELEIPFTLHAGEADGAESVKLAIEYGAKRIGHGVRINEDEEVMRLAKEKGVILEMCPTSNLQTCAVENDITKYPFVDYLNYGLKVTLNTDDPGIEGINLAHEFRMLESSCGLTAAQEKQSLLYSVDAAFTSDEVKEQLRRQINEW